MHKESGNNKTGNNKTASESDYFWSALMFYTRIPVPNSANHSQTILNRSRKYFPFIGVIVGMIGVLTYFVASLFFNTALSVAISMLSTVLATGAFHEDGFADSCDGLGGGWNIEQILTIMKDSRVGTYATVGLFFILVIKLLLLIQIADLATPLVFATTYVSAHALSRQLSSQVIESHAYVQDIDVSKVKPITERKLSQVDRRFSLVCCAIPLLALLVLAPLMACIAVLAAAITARLFAAYCNHRIGGYTGDILGAIQQLSELVFYLMLAAGLT